MNGYGVSTAVEGTQVTNGGSSSVFYQVALDTETLYQALDISQSVSVGFGPFGSVSEKSDFVRQLNLTTYSLNIVVHARHVKGVETATAFRLKNDVPPPVGNDQLRSFFRSYGDAFISSQTIGSEYYAVYTFYAQTREEQNSVTAELKANGIFEFGTVSGDLQAKLDLVTKKTQVRISFNQNVAGIANPKLPAPETLIQYALDFPGIPIDAPSILSFGSTGYEHVPGVGSFEPIAHNRTYLVGDRAASGLADDLAKVVQLDNQIDWLQAVYRFYGDYSDAKVSEAGKVVWSDIKAINDQLETYINDPTASFKRPPLPSLELGTPQLQYQIAESPVHGGDGGDPFYDVDVNTYLQRQTRISSVQLRSGGYVDALIVTYIDKDGTRRTANHGGGGGGLSQTLTLLPGQFVTSLRGRAGQYTDQLRVTISDNRSIGGGGDGGSPYSWGVPAGSVVLGFSGRSGRYLDQVEAVYATLQAAKWAH
ncbi:hypothetical protein DID96_30980 [Burkholderia sp. Bp8963]|nr:hypothetical protein DID96_30980 [Burkholderia sp. Bp8963]